MPILAESKHQDGGDPRLHIAAILCEREAGKAHDRFRVALWRLGVFQNSPLGGFYDAEQSIDGRETAYLLGIAVLLD